MAIDLFDSINGTYWRYTNEIPEAAFRALEQHSDLRRVMYARYHVKGVPEKSATFYLLGGCFVVRSVFPAKYGGQETKYYTAEEWDGQRYGNSARWLDDVFHHMTDENWWNDDVPEERYEVWWLWVADDAPDFLEEIERIADYPFRRESPTSALPSDTTEIPV